MIHTIGCKLGCEAKWTHCCDCVFNPVRLEPKTSMSYLEGMGIFKKLVAIRYKGCYSPIPQKEAK